MTILFVILTATFLPFYVYAWETCGTDANGDTANCEYQIVNGTLTIRGTGDNGNIGNWYSEEKGFNTPWRAMHFQNVIIENSIKNLCSYAFTEVHVTNPIQLPSGLTELSYGAFAYTTAPEVIIPNSVTTFGHGVFFGSNITKADIPVSVTDIGMGLRGSAFENIVVPNNVLYLPNSALSQCINLKSITIGENTQLGDVFSMLDETVGADVANLTIYCTGNLEKCKTNVGEYLASNVASATTKKINGVTYVYDKNGKLVTSSGHRTEKRIYTLEEANAVAGVKNRISIKYR